MFFCGYFMKREGSFNKTLVRNSVLLYRPYQDGDWGEMWYVYNIVPLYSSIEDQLMYFNYGTPSSDSS